MKIIEFKKEYKEDVKDLLVELQEYIVKLDKFNLNILTPEYREKYFEKTFNLINENKGKIFLAIENNKAIGMIAGYIAQYDEYDKIDYTCPQKGVIEELIVSSKSRQSGIGKALIEKIETYFKEMNCEYCQVDVFAYNENANKFYNKFNYENRMKTMFKKF